MDEGVVGREMPCIPYQVGAVSDHAVKQPVKGLVGVKTFAMLADKTQHMQVADRPPPSVQYTRNKITQNTAYRRPGHKGRSRRTAPHRRKSAICGFTSADSPIRMPAHFD